MHTLRLTQHSAGENKYRIEIALEGGQFRQSAVSEFEFCITPQDQESIRWYLEDYPLYRHDPAPKIADRVEKRMSEIGRELFEKVFESGKDSVKLWARFEEHLSDARIEVQTEVREATAIPWELIRDTGTDTCLALHAAAFVHSYYQPSRQFKPVENGEGPIRILLAICRAFCCRGHPGYPVLILAILIQTKRQVKRQTLTKSLHLRLFEGPSTI